MVLNVKHPRSPMIIIGVPLSRKIYTSTQLQKCIPSSSGKNLCYLASWFFSAGDWSQGFTPWRQFQSQTQPFQSQKDYSQDGPPHPLAESVVLGCGKALLTDSFVFYWVSPEFLQVVWNQDPDASFLKPGQSRSSCGWDLLEKTSMASWWCCRAMNCQGHSLLMFSKPLQPRDKKNRISLNQVPTPSSLARVNQGSEITVTGWLGPHWV